MICLECGAEVPYKSKTCPCGHAFPSPPPYMHANHVSQLQDCISRCLAGTMSPPDFFERYQRFANLFAEFDGRWTMLHGTPLEERLDPALQDRFRAGTLMLSRGFDYLAQAMEALDGALETGRPDDLEYAQELLDDYFRATCQGCAVLMYELEQLKGEDNAPGQLFDLKST